MTIQERTRQLSNKISSALQTMPTELAIVAENYTLDRFLKEDWDGRKWPERANDNEGDLNRDQRRGLLVASGALRRGIRRQVVANGFFIISDEVYSQIHNEGGTINHPGGTPYIVIKEAGELKTVFISKRKARELRRNGRKVKETGSHSIKIPKRQFIGKSRRLTTLMRKRFREIIAKAIA